MIVKILISCFLIIVPNFFFGQTLSKKEEVHLQIAELLRQEDVNGVNRLIKDNSFLDVTYIITVLDKNLQAAKAKNDPKALSGTYLTLGNFWHMHDNKIKAYDYYLKSERISKRQKDYNGLGTALMNRSTLLEDNDSRIKMVKQAIQAFEKTNNTLNLARAHLNTGIAYSEFVDAEINYSLLTEQQKKDIASHRKNAFKHYGIAESLNTSMQNNEIAGAIHIYYAEWYRYENKFLKAKEHFKKGKEYLTKDRNIKGIVYPTIEIALLERKLGNTQEALRHLQTAEQQAKKYRFKKYLEDIYEAYVSIYKEKKDLNKALNYQKLLTDIKVELTTLSNQDQLRILSLENELIDNQHKIEKFEAEERLNKLLISVSVFIIILLTILAYFIIKNKKRKIESIEKSNVINQLEKVKIETELKNQLLEEALLKEKVRFSQEHLIQFANQVNKIEKFLDHLKSSLKDITQNGGQREIINTLKLSFSEILNGQNHLKQLNSYTTQLNQEFFFYLNQNYPAISKNDEQLLAYIILDMDSKEIGRILNIATDSVYKKRHRLRQKLNLSKDDSFQNFYEDVMSRLK